MEGIVGGEQGKIDGCAEYDGIGEGRYCVSGSLRGKSTFKMGLGAGSRGKVGNKTTFPFSSFTDFPIYC